MQVVISNSLARARPGHPDPLPAVCWLVPVQGAVAVPSTSRVWLPGGLEHGCVTAWEVGGGPLGGQRYGNTNPSCWELCSSSLAACDTARVILLLKMMRPEAFVRHVPGSSEECKSVCLSHTLSASVLTFPEAETASPRGSKASEDQGICSPGSVSLQALLNCDPAATRARDQRMLHRAEPPFCPCASRCWSKSGELGLIMTLHATLEILRL